MGVAFRSYFPFGFFSLLFFCDYINMTLSSFLVVHGNVVPILERRHVPLRSSYSPFLHSPPSLPSILFVYFCFVFFSIGRHLILMLLLVD